MRQRAQEQNNRIEKRQTTLIAVVGVMIGTGEVLTSYKLGLVGSWLALMGLGVQRPLFWSRLFDLKIFKRHKKKISDGS